jgi:hypothetical protein
MGQPPHQGCQQGDVHAADGHQMGDAGGGEDLPLGRGNGALIAHRQGNQHPGVGFVGQGIQKTLADGFAPAFDPVAPAIGQPIQTPGSRRAHLPGGAHILLQQPGFKVKALRIQAAMGAAQAQGESPAFAWVHLRVAVPFVLLPAPIPGEQQATRDGGLARFHLEHEAHALVQALGEAGHHAAHPDVAPFLGQGQRIRETQFGTPGGIAGAQQQGCADQPQPAPVAPGRQQAVEQPQTACHAHGAPWEGSGQFGGPLDQQRARHPCNADNLHARTLAPRETPRAGPVG